MIEHDKFCPIWVVADRIMTECECELINKVRADMSVADEFEQLQDRIITERDAQNARYLKDAREVAYRTGFDAGLDAAEQSVGSIPYTEIDGYPFVIRAEALGAIRGLREEK